MTTVTVGDTVVVEDISRIEYEIKEIHQNGILMMKLSSKEDGSTLTLIKIKGLYYIKDLNRSVIIMFPYPNKEYDVTTYRYKIDEYSEIPNWLTSSIKNYAYNIKGLLKFKPFIEAVEDFSENLFGENLFDINLINDAYVKSRHIFSDIEALGGEQTTYLTQKDLLCDIYVITCKIDDQPYGAVFAFSNKDSDDLIIQGISKFAVPSIFSLMYPEKTSTMPRLNSILIPEVELLAKKLKKKRIIVDPFGHQGDILQKNYGFVPIERVEFPCKIILPPFVKTSRPMYGKIMD